MPVTKREENWLRKRFSSLEGYSEDVLHLLCTSADEWSLDHGYILRKEERKALAKVPTAIDEARIILIRNFSLLHRLLWDDIVTGVKKDKPTAIGCPHCDLVELSKESIGSHFSCSGCAWDTNEKAGPNSCPCLCQTFGGYGLNNTVVEYLCDKEYIEGGQSSLKVDCSVIFLWGHVEWAFLLLTGKMKASKKPFRVKGDSK